MTSIARRAFTWASSKSEMPISRYRLIVSLAACSYLFYFAATSPVRPLLVGAITVLTMFILDDCFRLLKLPRSKQHPPL